MEKALKIKGIHRSAKSRLHPDGTCNEIVNLRHREGAWEAIGNKKLYDQIPGLKEFKSYHDLGNGNHAIIYTGSLYTEAGTQGGFPYYVYQWFGLLAHVFYNGNTSTVQLYAMDESFDIKVGTINNVVVCNSETAIKYFVFQNGVYVTSSIDYNSFRVYRECMLPENNWKWLDDATKYRYKLSSLNSYDPGLYPFQSVSSGNTLTHFGKTEDMQYPIDYTASVNQTHRDALLAKFLELQTATEGLGAWAGKCYMMATLVLYDGTEVAHTAPTLQLGALLEARYFSYAVLASGYIRYGISPISLSSFVMDWDSVKGFKINIQGVDNYPEGLIKGVNIYITNPTAMKADTSGGAGFEQTFNRYYRPPSSQDWSGYKLFRDAGGVNYLSPSVNGSYYWRYTNNAYHFLVPQYPSDPTADDAFYKAAFIAIDDIQDGIGYFKVSTGADAEGNPLATAAHLVTQDAIPMDNNSRRAMTFGADPIQYNGRLFLSNIKSMHASPFSPSEVNAYNQQIPFNWLNKTTSFELLKYKVYNPLPEFYSGLTITDISLGYAPSPVYLTTLTGLGRSTMGTLLPSVLSPTGFPRWATGYGMADADPRMLYLSKCFYDVTVSTDQGDKTVRSGTFDVFGYQFDDAFDRKIIPVMIKPFSYPDINAKTVTFYLKPISFNGTAFNLNTWYQCSIDLKPSSFHNFAWANIDFHVNSPDDWTSQPVGITSYSLSPVQIAFIEDANRVQVSAINNPYVFPAANSYRVGTSEIIGLQTVNNEVSQGQFGQYPVIAFTKSGIWSLQIGNGDTLVSSVVPLANEVCNNVKSITAIRKGIFFTTSEGLKILQGSQVVDISDFIEGDALNAVKSSSILTQILTTDGLADSISTVDFIEYVKNAKVGYDAYFEEIIVSNSTYTYSYVYSITNNAWTKRNEVFDEFLNQFPHLLCVKDTGVYYTDQETKVGKAVLIVTNPIGSDLFVKIEQFIARGVFNSQAKLMFFASTDNRNFRLVASKVASECYDIHLPRTPYSFMSFVIAFEAIMDAQSYLNEFDISMMERYNNKLR